MNEIMTYYHYYYYHFLPRGLSPFTYLLSFFLPLFLFLPFLCYEVPPFIYTRGEGQGGL